MHGCAGVCRGDGYSETAHGKVRWAQGDVFVVPGSEDISHHASKESTEHGGAAFYWVTDEPLCKYLGVKPTENRFEPAHFTKDVSGQPYASRAVYEPPPVCQCVHRMIRAESSSRACYLVAQALKAVLPHTSSLCLHSCNAVHSSQHGSISYMMFGVSQS